MGISIVSKPHRSNCLNKAVLSLVKGDVKRKVFIPSRIMKPKLIHHAQLSRYRNHGLRKPSRDISRGKEPFRLARLGSKVLYPQSDPVFNRRWRPWPINSLAEQHV